MILLNFGAASLLRLPKNTIWAQSRCTIGQLQLYKVRRRYYLQLLIVCCGVLRLAAQCCRHAPPVSSVSPGLGCTPTAAMVHFHLQFASNNILSPIIIYLHLLYLGLPVASNECPSPLPGSIREEHLLPAKRPFIRRACSRTMY